MHSNAINVAENNVANNIINATKHFLLLYVNTILSAFKMRDNLIDSLLRYNLILFSLAI